MLCFEYISFCKYVLWFCTFAVQWRTSLSVFCHTFKREKQLVCVHAPARCMLISAWPPTQSARRGQSRIKHRLTGRLNQDTNTNVLPANSIWGLSCVTAHLRVCTDQRVAKVDECKSGLAQRCKTTKFAFARTRTVSVLPPAWRPCLAAGRPVCGRFLIIHTGGSVCGVMASDRPHMSVCVDQALCADRNEPSGWEQGGDSGGGGGGEGRGRLAKEQWAVSR